MCGCFFHPMSALQLLTRNKICLVCRNKAVMPVTWLSCSLGSGALELSFADRDTFRTHEMLSADLIVCLCLLL